MSLRGLLHPNAREVNGIPFEVLKKHFKILKILTILNRDTVPFTLYNLQNRLFLVESSSICTEKVGVWIIQRTRDILFGKTH